MNLIRKYKCYRLTDEIDNKTKEIFDFINKNILHLEKFEHNGYYNEWRNYIFYMNSDNKCIFQYNKNTKYIYIKYKKFWKILETEHKLDFEDIQTFLHYLIEKLYKIKIKVVLDIFTISYIQIELKYKIYEYNQKL